MYTHILTQTTNNICTITVNRPDKLNALNYDTIQEIGKAVKAAEMDKEVYGIIITGSGAKAFVAGADISEFAGYTNEQAMKLSSDGQKVFKSIELCTKPVVAAVNGFALGGGCELAMSCHLRVASDNAKFGQPEVNLGLIPGYAGTQRLVQLIGKTKAMELLMTADMIGAAEALTLGLVNYVTTPDQLLSKASELITKISSKGPRAIAGIVRCVDAYFTDGVDGFDFEVKEFGSCFGTPEFKEGVEAFLGKRKAEFRK
ncbi:MAG: enoyl-CoA hydratase-related protein [Bacteroidia bacterium]